LHSGLPVITLWQQEDVVRAAIRKMGNSSGVIIPKPILNELGVQAGDKIEMTLEAGKVILAPVKRSPREGWAESAKALAEAGDDALVWPEFGNADDEKLVW
jgi:antitoxin MazE